MLKRWRGQRGERGQSMVEFAMIAPAFFALFFGIMEAGAMFNAWATVQHASLQGARFAVTGGATCSGGSTRDACIVSQAQTAAAMLSGSVSVTLKSWDYPSYTAQSASSGGPCDAVEVSVSYVYSMRTPVISSLRPSVTMVGRQRFINEPFGTCS